MAYSLYPISHDYETLHPVIEHANLDGSRKIFKIAVLELPELL
jgi:hypothetical protein